MFNPLRRDWDVGNKDSNGVITIMLIGLVGDMPTFEFFLTLSFCKK